MPPSGLPLDECQRSTFDVQRIVRRRASGHRGPTCEPACVCSIASYGSERRLSRPACRPASLTYLFAPRQAHVCRHDDVKESNLQHVLVGGDFADRDTRLTPARSDRGVREIGMRGAPPLQLPSPARVLDVVTGPVNTSGAQTSLTTGLACVEVKLDSGGASSALLSGAGLRGRACLGPRSATPEIPLRRPMNPARQSRSRCRRSSRTGRSPARRPRARADLDRATAFRMARR